MSFLEAEKDLIYFATVSPLKAMVQPETEMHTIFPHNPNAANQPRHVWRPTVYFLVCTRAIRPIY